MWWQNFKASFKSKEHLRDYVLALVASILAAFCVGALLLAWFLL